MDFPYIYTFYSYKGGVGRSMALVNAAYALAGYGRHVLMVDMDLEAPGISGFLERSDELGTSQNPEDDVLSVLEAGLNIIHNGAPTEEDAAKLPSLGALVRSIPASKRQSLQPKYGVLGRLDILPVRTDGSYTERLSKLALSKLDPERIGHLSNLLREWFKRHRFSHPVFGLEDFEPPAQVPYDYILVDSRTGITEIGGLCVGPLADRLVVLTGLNDQNVHGTKTFLQEVGIQPAPRPASDAPWDAADPISNRQSVNIQEEGVALGPKPTILVASPAPAGEVDRKQVRLQLIQESLGLRPLTLTYHPLMAVLETNFVRDYPEEPLAQEYRRLVSRMMQIIGDDARSLSSEINRLQEEAPSIASAIENALRIASEAPDLGEVVLKHLGNKWLSAEVVPDPHIRRVIAFLSQDPIDAPMSLVNWGSALDDRARRLNGEEADLLWEAACGKYRRALNLKPDVHEALFNWGNALAAQALSKQDEEADRLWEAAYEKYARALEIKPDNRNALNNWGNALDAQAQRKLGEEADRLREAAYEKYVRALEIKPDMHEALINWGATLNAQALSKQGEEADRLWEAAYEKYGRALEIKPDAHEVLTNWAAALDGQARRKQGEEADRLYGTARELLLRAEDIQPG